MADDDATSTTLWAISDLHVAVKANKAVIENLEPRNPADWLIVAGDVAERPELVLKTLGELSRRWAQVIWVPGNHELFCRGADAQWARTATRSSSTVAAASACSRPRTRTRSSAA